MKCPECNKEISPDATYDELWYHYIPGQRYVTFVCEDHIWDELGREVVNPHRFKLKYGKFKDYRISEIEDLQYLEWMLTKATTPPEEGEYDKRDPLLAKAIQACL